MITYERAATTNALTFISVLYAIAHVGHVPVE